MSDDLHAQFQPDYTPEQLENLGVYDSLYRGQGPRLASLGAWKPEWISEHDPKGWAQWYKRYSSGRRIQGEDDRQIKRWLSFKARHGGPFTKSPTPRRGWALRNWGVDPSKLVATDQQAHVQEMLDAYKAKAMQKHIALQQKTADLNPDIKLQDHQQRIADRVTNDESRLLVYHGLGSGKSLSAIAAAEAAKKKYKDDYGIVVPAALKGNFEKEVGKFTTNSSPEIMSYTGLALGKNFAEQPDTVIMDEAHRLRNPGSASGQAAKRVARNAKNLLLLTGSPVTNSPSDLANLLGMLHNKNITPEDFEKRFIDYENVNPGVVNWFRGVAPGERAVVKNEDQLRGLLRGKIDYQPSKTPEGVNVNEEVIRVPLSPDQQKIQKAIRTKIPPGFLWKLDKEFPMSRDELAKLNSFLTGLRQVSLSTQPFRYDKDPAKAFGQSAKLQTAMKNLQGVLDSDPRKKAIIYSNFIDSGLKPYSSALEKAKIPHGIFHGSIPVKQRLQALKDYNEGKLRALLLGPAAAEGISTKGTSLIQLLDPHWHESRSQQAKGRGLRFDSHQDLPEELKNVAVQRYISSSEDPSWLGKLMGYQRERTGDEVLEHLTADKERLNEVFRKILREEGSVKNSNYIDINSGVSRWFTEKQAVEVTLADQTLADPPKLPAFTNQYAPKKTPSTVGGVPAGAWKAPPGPVKPIPAQLPNRGATDSFDNPTTNAWDQWLNRNYTGDGRFDAINDVQKNVIGSPATLAQYGQVLDKKFHSAQARARQPFEFGDERAATLELPFDVKQPLIGAAVTPPQWSDSGKAVVHLPSDEEFLGQKAPMLGRLGNFAQAAGVPRSTWAKSTFGRGLYLPAMTRSLVGLHEFEHVNQQHDDDRVRGDQQPYIDGASRKEPAAVLNEVVHAADAARQATGKPVTGNFALTPQYKPSLEWMRQQAQQHRLDNMGPNQNYGRTMTELLNTPEGQAWMRMQLQQLEKTNAYSPNKNVKPSAFIDPVAGVATWFAEKAAAPRKAVKKTKAKKTRRPAPGGEALAGAVGAGAAAFPLMSLHQDAFSTYPILKERVKGSPLYFADEMARANPPIIQHGDVATYFGEPQSWFKSYKPNFSKLTQGGEWTSGTGTFHGMMLRPHNGDVQVLEGGDAFGSYDIDKKDPRFLTSPFFDFMRKRDAEDAAKGLIPKEDVGLYSFAKRNPDGTLNPRVDINLRDVANNTSGGFFNRNFLALRNAMEGGAGDAAKMPFMQRYMHYNKHLKRQHDLLQDYLKTIKSDPASRERIWGPLSERTTAPILVTRSDHMADLLRKPETRPIVEQRVNQAYRDYAYQPYDLAGAMQAGGGRVFFPKVAPQEKQLGIGVKPTDIPPYLKPTCNESYCVTPAAKTLASLGTPLGVSTDKPLPADLAAGTGFRSVGMIVPKPSPDSFSTLYGGKKFKTPQELYGNDAPAELTPKQTNTYLNDVNLQPETYKEDYRKKVLSWMEKSRNRRIATGLLAAAAVGAGGYGATKLVQRWMNSRKKKRAKPADKGVENEVFPFMPKIDIPFLQQKAAAARKAGRQV